MEGVRKIVSDGGEDLSVSLSLSPSCLYIDAWITVHVVCMHVYVYAHVDCCISTRPRVRCLAS